MATPRIAYEEALANLNRGGLSGNTLSMAQTALKNSYSDSPGATTPTPTSITPPESSSTGSTPTTPVATPKNTNYDSALKSYLGALEGSNRTNEMADSAAIRARRQYLDTLDKPGGLKSGAQESATLFNRNASANLADIGVAQNAATNASQVALERLKYEQGQLPKPGEAFNLSPGQARYDASGNQIASLPGAAPSITDQYGTGSIGEYNFAKSQGYSGTFSQYQNEDANRKAVIAKAGANSSTTPKTLEERNMQSAQKVSTLFSPGYTIPESGGVPYVDAEGYATPQGWKTAMSASGLTRTDFIKQFGYLITLPDGSVPTKYNLTAAEKKLITG